MFPIVQTAVNMQNTSICIYLRLCLLVAASHFVFVCLVKVGQCVSLACTGMNQSEACLDNQEPIMWLFSGALDNVDGSVLSE